MSREFDRERERYESFMAFATYGKNPMDIHFFDEDDKPLRQSFLDAIDEDDLEDDDLDMEDDDLLMEDDDDPWENDDEDWEDYDDYEEDYDDNYNDY